MVIKCTRLRWTDHIARMGEESKTSFKILTGKPTEKKPLGQLGVLGKTSFEWILNKYLPKW